MATVQINLPDELAQKAASAGLLSAEAMEAMLREQLRRRAGEALQAMWKRGPQEELTPEIEQEIVEEVRKVRADPLLSIAGRVAAAGIEAMSMEEINAGVKAARAARRATVK